jgi:hypothetical protein
LPQEQVKAPVFIAVGFFEGENRLWRAVTYCVAGCMDYRLEEENSRKNAQKAHK